MKKEFDFDKYPVSNFINVDKNGLGKGKHLVSILLILISKDGKNYHHRIGREANDRNIDEKIAFIKNRIETGKAVEDIKMLNQIKDSDIQELMLIGNWTFVPSK